VQSVLILGGTAEARALAASLTARGVSVTSSLAGRVADPALPVGAVRIGGFGGADGLASYLAGERTALVVDATHPFATTISRSAATACHEVAVPLLRLVRPGWGDHPDADSWQWVDSYAAAAARAAELGSRIMLTTGRTTLPHFYSIGAEYVLVRLVEPTGGLPVNWEVISSRGPYTVPGERELMTSRRIDVLVTKDSGGAMTAPKLDAAALAGVQVVVVRRPSAATRPAGSPVEVGTVELAADWVLQTLPRS
jgi:precorrin-6A/cobalt-precorrin-6A reductase